MARPYSNDLRRKFLQSYDRGNASLREVAEQYGVSLGWAKKISARRSRTGQTDLVAYRHGPQSRVTAEVQQWLRARVGAQADLTLGELQQSLVVEQQVQLSVARLWGVLQELGLRFKKKPSTPANARRWPPRSGGKRGGQKSNRSIHPAWCLWMKAG
jgi:transposase